MTTEMAILINLNIHVSVGSDFRVTKAIYGGHVLRARAQLLLFFFRLQRKNVSSGQYN
jgi:hypothetical protein